MGHIAIWREHIAALAGSLPALEREVDRLESWGERLTPKLLEGARLLVCGNGGSAAQAQHLAAELVGRYRTEREPLSALCLNVETATLTALANDYDVEEMFARQLRAHGRPGDVLLLLSTSGRSANLLAAVHAATALDVTTWALTGPGPNPLCDICDETIQVPAPSTATIQELHLVAIHLLCAAVDREVASRTGAEAVAPAYPVLPVA